ncbi:MAG: hypothetical protein IJU48_01450 [Synergistaceae bacterium]|nr:hypothetical protein [Synergistaceae bacterium]
MARCFSVILLALIFAAPSYALSAAGVPEWLEPAVIRSLNAVWSEIPNEPEIDREGTLALVAQRLFAGYDVQVKPNRDEPAVIFTANDEKKISTDVKIIKPELRGIAQEWFDADVSGLPDEILRLINNLPQSALTWSDEALRERINLFVKEILPGWEFSMQIFLAPASTLINLSFRPGNPMILAVKPALYSRTIPAIFRSDIEARLIPELSPLIGVPVKWAEAHKLDVENFARVYIKERHSVENLRAKLNVKFLPGTVSNLEAGVDSEDFVFNLWVAAYAGIEGRYPEIGAFFAFRPSMKFNPEFYFEAVFSLSDFDEVHRLGGRFELFNNVWLGAEVQWPENKYFIRFLYNPVRVHKPYFWWRWSPELEVHEMALGYRLDEHVSIELYYDTEGEDKFGLRGLWHL